MSQNKTKEDLDGVIAGLRSETAVEAASKVEYLRPEDKK
jgi:predicted FMN-binding regulatory protein PaiB